MGNTDVPAKQSPSCTQHNMNDDIFKWENMGMSSLPVEVPDDASLVRFSLACNQAPIVNAMFDNVHAKRTLLLTFVLNVTGDATSLLAMPILSLFPPQLMTYVEKTDVTCIVKVQIIKLGTKGQYSKTPFTPTQQTLFNLHITTEKGSESAHRMKSSFKLLYMVNGSERVKVAWTLVMEI